MFPYTRLRRTRRHDWFRELVSENTLSPSDLILPLFVIEGKDIIEEIPTLPGVHRRTIDEVEQIAKEASKLGIKAIALFPSIDESLKSENGDEAYNQDNLICRCVRHLKHSGVDIGIICDVALDPYTSHGHDGIVVDGHIDNDRTIEALKNQALTLAKAGVDIVAPSDMMDGRIAAIRGMLEENGFDQVAIISYSAKYASNFYGPFRDAVGSKGLLGVKDKKSYQMDYRNSNEAIREIELDIEEGADIILIKPGMPYLDIIKEASQNFLVPIFGYQVSGEYAMIKFADRNNVLEYEKALIESLICFKRAGAKCIFTYGALDAARLLKNN